MGKPKGRISISDVIVVLGISRKTYYNWEAAKKIPKARRDPMNGYRYYTKEDVEKLKRLTQRG